MKTLLNASDRQDLLNRLAKVRPDSQRGWGRMTAPQMICHLNDSFRLMLGEKYASPDTNLFKRIGLKWLALWVPVPWAHGFRTRPELDQEIGGTRPGTFEADVRDLRDLFDRFCSPATRDFQPHPFFGQLSTAERMRWAYLHIDHHLRQFGV